MVRFLLNLIHKINTMKKIFYFFSLLLIASSCNKMDQTKPITIIPENKEVLPKELSAVDSVKINDSIKVNEVLTAKFSSKVLMFSNLNNIKIADSIYHYADINPLKDYNFRNLDLELQAQKEAYFNSVKKDSKDFKPSFNQTWEENSSMDFLSFKNDILTIMYQNDGYSGGAHGYYNILYKNFDLKKNSVIQVSDVFKDAKSQEISDLLMKYFINKEQKEMLLEQKITANNNFYFDDKSITFVYNHYEITAYAAGVVEITIPFSVLKPYLKPDFISRNNLK